MSVYVWLYVASLLEPTHERSHAQTTLVKKGANDKAREDCATANYYQRKKAERKTSWLRFVLKLQNENLDIELGVESQIPIEIKEHEGGLSSLKL